jgi:hypothetical protein
MGDDPRQVGRKTRRAQGEAVLSRIRAGFEPRRDVINLHVAQREGLAEDLRSSATQNLTPWLKTGTDNQLEQTESSFSPDRVRAIALSPFRPLALSPRRRFAT